ncbi:hypothetical protein [Allomesorhizobium alhagi]|uniref:Uncharacterized protein n=1 Tax=Mesorhizobium alhagi CCNWXJ12-2 TaxID=1107882 RepID=H0HWY6_9HYPH|nr:hypothetical protein [Mesorhizobium alhagi]EHK54747.1 hypothetical protein MAXJ12_23517 [Mesorhizobium alhagi CCNWXJ12-2]
MNWRKYFEQLRPDQFDGRTNALIRSLLDGKDLNRLDARTQRQLRAILKEHERKRSWLKGKTSCPTCAGEGLAVAPDPGNAPIVKNGVGFLPSPCAECKGQGYVETH